MPVHQGQPVLRPLPKREWVYLQEAEAAGYGSYSHLRHKIRTGQLPAHKYGGRVVVLLADLDAQLVPIQPVEPAFEDVEVAVERIVASAPPLTDEQCRRLAGLFGGAP